MAQMSGMDVSKLATALAGLLVNAMDVEGAKESGGGWDAIAQGGIEKYMRGRKSLGGFDAAVHAHGPGGMFSTPGIENIVINASMTPIDLDPRLRVYPTVFMNPLYPTLTGFDEDEGSEPDGLCEDCKGGTMQGCLQTSQFGHVCRSGDEIHISRTIQMINRGETTPLTLLGDVLSPGGLGRMPNTPSDWLEVTTKAEMVKAAILIQRWLMKTTWTGNPSNNTASGGYKEFPGLDILVGTGKVDAITQNTCESLDSYVLDFDDDIDSASTDIVQYISQLEWYIRHVAERTGLMPVEWVFCMRPELWQELTAIWPCRYLTNRCTQIPTGSAATVMTLSGDENVRMRDAMRTGSYLTVNGRQYEVVVCDGIAETAGKGEALEEYTSDIFFLPLTVRGGMSVLYWEHLDYAQANAQIAMLNSQNDFWTDGGRFLWTVERMKGCYKVSMEMDPRLVLRTPQLAGRIDDVTYSPLAHLRSPFSDSAFFKKGGTPTRPDPTVNWYTEWRS